MSRLRDLSAGLGLKMTPQRFAVARALSATAKHPRAEDIYGELRPATGVRSMTTVYNNLNLLCEIGLAQRFVDAKGETRFDANASPHVHFACTACGAVTDLEALGVCVSDCAAFKTCLAEGYSVRSVSVTGTCPRCSGRKERER